MRGIAGVECFQNSESTAFELLLAVPPWYLFEGVAYHDCQQQRQFSRQDRDVDLASGRYQQTVALAIGGVGGGDQNDETNLIFYGVESLDVCDLDERQW